MSGTSTQTAPGTDSMPSLRHASVGDAMHPGIVSCDADAFLTEAAQLMASHDVHCIVVMAASHGEQGGDVVWGLISDLDLMHSGMRPGSHRSARELASEPVVSVRTTMPLRHAGEKMLEHGVSHMVVIDPETTRPIGVLSTLDVIGVLAGKDSRIQTSPEVTGSLTTRMPHGGNYLMPSLPHATVSDAMHPGILACEPDASLPEVARIMVTSHVHCVAVVGISHEEPECGVWSAISDQDLLRAGLRDGETPTARAIARQPLVTVEPSMQLREAGELMAENGVTHLVVVEPRTERPIGILSTADIAGVLAWGEV